MKICSNFPATIPENAMKTLAALLIMAAVPAFSEPLVLTPEEVEARYAAPGYAYGDNHCYGFAAPQGWYMDNITARQLGVGMVFLPEGATWENAPVAMYTRPFSLDGVKEGEALIAAALDSAEATYRQHDIDVQRERIDTLQSESGEQGELWRLNMSAPDSGQHEYVAYFPAGDTLSVFVIQVGGKSNAAQAERALRELARSYHRRSICEPCNEDSKKCQ